ncbi:MAG TPA: hypothetical protein VND41_05640 [Nitrososphaerales archaeon]|nr:hypothetical protein [Nitrososphaerales archaeon]
MNQSFLVLGLGLALLGMIIARSGRRKANPSPQGEKRATTSTFGPVGMFFLGLGLVLVIIGL